MNRSQGDDFDHVGITVPDLEQALHFFTEVLGCKLWYYEGPFSDDEGDSMADELHVESRAVLQCATITSQSGAKIELLEYQVPGKSPTEPPQNSDNSAAHLAFRVADLDDAVLRLAAQPDVHFGRGPSTIEGGRSHGLRWIYCTAPWGLQLELVELPAQLVQPD